ncbi:MULTISPECIES: HAD family hydrolase [Anaerostipes]|uniref:HAD family hydrolase n=1 Tax=Anaerostipes TaxID=207244 RepID=UPI001C1E43B3|nr:MULTISPECIES: HAD-IA family hydrolase [Anaerostipes]MCI5622449.1 HAD-IA family hydrolase [Anaerostipes sp.]MDY2725587.1 HAD-IA family hydrolase [Anaerostipes faecalis]
MKYKLAIFDMDGTILNTLEDLCDATNYALSQSDYPARTIDEVRRFVGNGIRKLIERAVPTGTEEPEIEKVHEDFTKYYKVHCADKTKPYDGIMKLLEKLRAAGCQTAVVSNKADYAVQELCEQYFQGMFDAAAGEKEGIAKKPAPDSVNAVMKKLGTTKEHAVYIGDSEVDIETAKNAGLDCIVVEWGFRDREYLEEKGGKTFVTRPEEIKERILGDLY